MIRTLVSGRAAASCAPADLRAALRRGAAKVSRVLAGGLAALALLAPLPGAFGQSGGAPLLTSNSIADLQLRNIGPMLTPGRAADIAVDPKNKSIWYYATASAGLWKTTNRGTTWRSVFDEGGSYSMGCVTVDPKDSNVVWLGTGENQSLRSVSFGDGLYKSTDAGETWKKAGLANSEHIAKIIVDPRDSNVVYVAAQGPLWAPGGDRGLYKTTDGGKTWKAIISISENTGVTDVEMDPTNPDLLYAASYQRRRNVGVLIGGGPEAHIYKSTDAGATWKILKDGLPKGDMGRIALAISPQKPEVVYAHITAHRDETGFYRSEDHGETWKFMSGFAVQDPQYYGELTCDPHHFDTVYAVDMTVKYTTDGGKTVQTAPWGGIHVDNHAIWFDPDDANHILEGNDGGLYETYDEGRTWHSFNNMCTTQYYHVSVDNAVPFYNVYGGAQDNGTTGAPSRSINSSGLRASDGVDVGGGDGMQPRVDPEDPNIVYSNSQFNSLGRLDRRTSANAGIRAPARTADGETVRYGWNVPFIISPYSHTRLYYAGSTLFKSDDRGTSWTAISGDLTRHLDRDKIPVMGKLWPEDAVSRNTFTTDLGVGTALAESPKKEGLIFYGSDDGLLQITENDGKSWRKIDKFPGIPDMTTVQDVYASNHDANTLYVAFNHYMTGDFKPYLLKSTDLGKTWKNIAGDLPDKHFIWCVMEDPVDENLLFAGTEFGLFFTVDGGTHWVQFQHGMPTTAFRDLEFQKREGDLVCATFGRGIWILDDYAALRGLTSKTMAEEGAMLPVRRAYLYNELTYTRPPANDFGMPNLEFGADLTYYLKGDEATSGAQLALVVTDGAGKEVRRIPLSGEALTAGVHRTNWNLRLAPAGGAGGFGGRGAAGFGGRAGAGRGARGGRGGRGRGGRGAAGADAATTGTLGGDLDAVIGEPAGANQADDEEARERQAEREIEAAVEAREAQDEAQQPDDPREMQVALASPQGRGAANADTQESSPTQAFGRGGARGGRGGGPGAAGGRGGRGGGRGGRGGGGPLVTSGEFTVKLVKTANGQTTTLGQPQTFEAEKLPGVTFEANATSTAGDSDDD